MMYKVRKASTSDSEFIYKLLYTYSEKKMILPRSYNQIYEYIRDFFICEDDSGKKAGCAALHIFWKDIAEVRSLAVEESHQGNGCGRMLVKACLEEAGDLQIPRVFVLTYQVDFFKKMGFKKVLKEELPHKIWSDCLNCVKFPDCDEVSLVWTQEKAQS